MELMQNLEGPWTPAKIVDKKVSFSVPIYQRLFVWERQQTSQLMSDLWEAFKSSAKSNPNPYYLGAITVHASAEGGWEVVDGQQRLTFATLLGCCFVREHLSEEWRNFVLEDDHQLQQDDPRLRIKYTGRMDDGKMILAIMNQDDLSTNNAGTNCSNEKFLDFYKVFEEFLFALRHDSCVKDELEGFAKFCYESYSFLVNELPAAYGSRELNVYFEKMNSTGIQLTPVEMVKGLWFAKFSEDWNACLNFDKRMDYNQGSLCLVEDKEDSLMDILENIDRSIDKGDIEKSINADEKTDHPLFSRLVMRKEVLLLHVLSLCCQGKGEVALDYQKLLKTFKERINDDNREDFVKKLCQYRHWLDQNIIFLEKDGNEYQYSFRDEADEINDEEKEKKFASLDRKRNRQFQSMLYVSSGERQEWVLNAYRKSNGQRLTLEILKEVDREAHRGEIPEDGKMCYPIVDRYWFWRLDYELWDMFGKDGKALGGEFNEKEKAAIQNYRFRRNRSIEHLHPQSDADENSWGSRNNPDSKMHQFGNLAMMSVEGNSAQSNDGIGTKFGRVEDWISSGRLESIKMLLMFKLAQGKQEGWTVEKAEAHSIRMRAILEGAYGGNKV